MNSAHFDRFFAEAVRIDRATDGGLGEENLYGLYTSWCLLNELQPESPEALWAALRGAGIEPTNNNLAMTGPAATDYIISSEPNLL